MNRASNVSRTLLISSIPFLLFYIESQVLTTLANSRPASNTISDSCHLRELELCFVGAGAIFQNPNGIPIAKPEIDRLCEIYEESSNCFSSYSERCLTDPQYELARFYTGGIFDLQREFCQPESTFRADYMKHASCLKQFQKLHQVECVSQFQVAFEPIHKMEITKRLNLTCW